MNMMTLSPLYLMKMRSPPHPPVNPLVLLMNKCLALLTPIPCVLHTAVLPTLVTCQFLFLGTQTFHI